MNCVHGREQGIGCPHCHGYSGQAFPAPRVDAEHRAELDQCQTDLKSARHSLLQSDNQVARLVAENERLRGELGEAKRALTEIQNCTNECYLCDDHRDAPQLGGAPPPSAPPCTASAGACNSPKACSEAGKCIDARMREFVAPAESTPVHRDLKPDNIRERPAVVYATQAQLDQRMRMVSERLDALEAKGESGTFQHYFSSDGKKRCEVCGLPEDRPSHAKGAKP